MLRLVFSATVIDWPYFEVRGEILPALAKLKKGLKSFFFQQDLRIANGTHYVSFRAEGAVVLP